MVNKKKIICICGATATGKTALALKIAGKLGTEIISCDSMQIYRHMDIGTAKPTKEEMALIKHHMIDIVEPNENYSVSDYVNGSKKIIDTLCSEEKIPVICGGTGLYLDSLLRTNSFAETVPPDPDVRKELKKKMEEEGPEAIFEILKTVDPESAEAIHPNNTKRVIRALEIYYTTKKKKSELDKESRSIPSEYDYRVINILFSDRNVIRERINKRVDFMIEEGLVDEVGYLVESELLKEGSTASQAIGYKEIISYLKGSVSLDEAVEKIKLRTRQYAKRQITWFRKYDKCFIVPDREDDREIEQKVDSLLKAWIPDQYSH